MDGGTRTNIKNRLKATKKKTNKQENKKHLLSLDVLCFGMGLRSNDSLHVTSPTKF